MFQAARMLYLYVETPLHAGTGRGLGAIDLPIQRERLTGYPIVQASGLKGRLRAECYDHFWRMQSPSDREAFKLTLMHKLKQASAQQGKTIENGELNQQAEKEMRRMIQEFGFEAAFGPDTDNADEHAGAVSPGDARLLLFPVRSLAGVFAWTTSIDALSRFWRHANMIGMPNRLKMKQGDQEVEIAMKLPPAPAKDEAWIAEAVDHAEVVAGGKIVLEEFTFTPKSNHQDFVKALGTWLAQHALPEGEAYQYWRDNLPKRLVILPEDAFRDFTQFSTEVVTRIKIKQETKTVEQGALWTEESLPTDTLLYAPLMATAPRTGKNNLVDANKQTAMSMLQLVESSLPRQHIQLGGDETVGRGTVCLRFGSVHEFTTNRKGN